MIKANNCMSFNIFHIVHTPILIFMFSFFFHILFIYVLPKQGNSFYVCLSDRSMRCSSVNIDEPHHEKAVIFGVPVQARHKLNRTTTGKGQRLEVSNFGKRM